MQHREHPKVTTRERANVIETSTCSSLQDIAVQMQHAQQQEENDPVNKPPHETTSEDADLSADKDADSSSSEVRVTKLFSLKILCM